MFSLSLQGITWGKAFLIAAEDKAALPYLSTRECQLGGYRIYTVNFHPKPLFLPSTSHSSTDVNHNSIEKKNALLYIAVPENRHWLGAAPLPDIARQILECRGSSGSNAEYLLRLADFMREEIPEALDEHLFSLERLVKKFAAEMKICLKTLMGDVEKAEESKPEAKAVVPSFQFASRIPDKKLRCVNMWYSIFANRAVYHAPRKAGENLKELCDTEVSFANLRLPLDKWIDCVILSVILVWLTKLWQKKNITHDFLAKSWRISEIETMTIQMLSEYSYQMCCPVILMAWVA